MSREQIRQLLEERLPDEGTTDIGVKGVQLFRVTTSLACAPAMYEPTLVAIVTGRKQAILGGERHVYDHHRYLCCAMTMPVEAGTPDASPDDPLLGVTISLDRRLLTKLVIEMEAAPGSTRNTSTGPLPQGVSLARWDEEFTQALLRLLQLMRSPTDAAVLGEGRLCELYYAMLKGDAGASARSAFGVGSDIARAIDYLSVHLDEAVTIEDMASRVGMSRAAFHRKFKQATLMSPIQFVKQTRLNTAAMRIAGGMNVSEAAQAVGYVSASQFSRDFKRMYGQSPKQWSHSKWVGPEPGDGRTDDTTSTRGLSLSGPPPR